MSATATPTNPPAPGSADSKTLRVCQNDTPSCTQIWVNKEKVSLIANTYIPPSVPFDGTGLETDAEQEQMLIQRNSNYQVVSGLGEMILSVIQRPENDEQGQWMTIKELSVLLKGTFKGYKEEVGTFNKIGAFLSRPEYRFKRKRLNAGMVYWVSVME